MLEQAPGSEGLAGGLRAPQLGRPVGDRVLERDMGVIPFEQLDEVVPKRAVGIGATRFALDCHGAPGHPASCLRRLSRYSARSARSSRPATEPRVLALCVAKPRLIDS